ncbi:maltose alpha-D-glucosyltransferase [Schaalia sp. ZJ1691]|uniref:maltose alpha-D-glucosyltransferase n=1 Tax=Schaalia sp. ZJ1691 TaxID=2709404 RepID=UPI0013ED37FA|nr:maltose alpha-D-glucosyltransferase [Schaalia sp. ZJ1691]
MSHPYPPDHRQPVLGASSLPPLTEDTHWYRRAVFYEVMVQSFKDSNGDGIGDFPGLMSTLDYLSWLGVDCLWVPPFYPSPGKDDGYDVADYMSVNPAYGTLEDFTRFVREAHVRGIRVLVDMVLNHTSDQHPWFQSSREDPAGPFGDFYVWRDTPTGYPDVRVIFTDTEESNWAWDPVRRQFYWHRFFSHQPDLNYENPAVRRAVIDVVRFWCSTGVDGFRLDAIPYLFEEEGTNGESLPATHHFIATLREVIDTEFPGTVMLAEANQPPRDVVAYFGSDDQPECHMCFHFPVMPRIFQALREESSQGLRTILAETPPLPQGGQWAMFLRNHDELTLEMVSDEERDNMYRWYAPDPQMRANVGIGRRLAPLLHGSQREVEIAHALLLSLPGSPFLYYGDEIGMGDDYTLPDRYGVRTPMQWDAGPGGGFSDADPADFVLPMVSSPGWDHRAINVSQSRQREHSLLNWLRKMLAVRREHPAFGIGSMSLLSTDDDAVLAFLRRDESETILCVTNLSSSSRAVRIQLPGMGGWGLKDLATGHSFPTVNEHEYVDITLPRHSFYWLSVSMPKEQA